MVTVYVWDFRGKDVAWGHASMHVSSGTPAGTIYISWWPQAANRSAKIPKAPGPLRQVYSVPAISGRAYTDDVRDEGQAPDHTIALAGLDETAIKTWWNALLADSSARWSTLGQNCSTTVAHALAAGGGDKFTTGISGWWRSWNTVWEPNDVTKYARAIEQGLKAHAAAIP